MLIMRTFKYSWRFKNTLMAFLVVLSALALTNGTWAKEKALGHWRYPPSPDHLNIANIAHYWT